MKHLLLTIVIFGLAASTPIIAGQAEYDDCILEHLKNAKLDVTTQLIRQACKENHKHPGFTSDKQRAYNNCLLEHFVGIESIQAVMDIKAVCDRKYR